MNLLLAMFAFAGPVWLKCPQALNYVDELHTEEWDNAPMGIGLTRTEFDGCKLTLEWVSDVSGPYIVAVYHPFDWMYTYPLGYMITETNRVEIRHAAFHGNAARVVRVWQYDTSPFKLRGGRLMTPEEADMLDGIASQRVTATAGSESGCYAVGTPKVENIGPVLDAVFVRTDERHIAFSWPWTKLDGRKTWLITVNPYNDNHFDDDITTEITVDWNGGMEGHGYRIVKGCSNRYNWMTATNGNYTVTHVARAYSARTNASERIIVRRGWRPLVTTREDGQTEVCNWYGTIIKTDSLFEGEARAFGSAHIP